jgi:hypothetical protein
VHSMILRAVFAMWKFKFWDIVERDWEDVWDIRLIPQNM